MNKKQLFTLLQIAVTAALLVWLFRDAEQNRQLLRALREADLRWVLAGIASFGVVILAGITRWQILLRVQGIHFGWVRLGELFMIGLLFNPFLPGGTGGDVAKIYYLLRETPGKKAAALLTVFMDRLVGLFGLILIAGSVMLVRYDWLTGPGKTFSASVFYPVFGFFAAALAFLVISFAITGFGLVEKLPQRLPLRDKIVELSVAYLEFGKAWKQSLLALLLCVPVHLGSFTVFYCTAQAFRESRSFELLQSWAVMPIVNTIIAMPVSIGGTGVREGLFVGMLGELCNIQPAIAKALSLTGYFVLIFWSLVGGVVYLTYKKGEKGEITVDGAGENGVDCSDTDASKNSEGAGKNVEP